ncbi:MAG: hypothetical protein A2X12_01840 [Bacteroidetes bacterium GWE2_29_8]|nr:MAG: hypothetical protein A2X12_01840 [Bacteroidetes bacterium GWE2_29_8]OFY23969.1 MAG: hypothetical protein A2X02_00970 [Bacteroidetes bacterium GWF2_29_10]
MKILLSLFIILISLVSCNNKQKQETKKEITFEEIKEPMLRTNITLYENENEQIEDYIRRYKWDVNKTNTGIRYLIYKKGNGEKARNGKTAIIAYTLSLINGNVAYKKTEQNPEQIEIGKSVIRGLEEGILLLRVGDKAKIIIPSNLGYGLLGDEKRIPSRATLIYDLSLIDLY